MGPDNQLPNPNIDTNTDLRAEIERVYQFLISAQSDLYSKIAMGIDDEAIINLFSIGFYPKWNSFFNVTQLGFTEEYETKKPGLATCKTTAADQIKGYMEKQSIAQIKAIFETFDDYMAYVKDQKMVVIRK